MKINQTSLTTRIRAEIQTKIKGKLISSKLWSSRLIQNRKSAMKCRLKKKAEFEKLRDDFNQLKEDKIILNSQVIFKTSNISQYQQSVMMYEEKIKENQQLKDKFDQLQQMQTAMLAYVLS